MISPLTPPRASIDHSFAVASHRIYIHLNATSTSSNPNHTQLCGDDDDTNDHHERLRGEARGEDRAVSLFQGFSYGQSG